MLHLYTIAKNTFGIAKIAKFASFMTLCLYMFMQQIIPEKFPRTGINVLAADGGDYTPGKWPEAVDFVNDTVRQKRETAIGEIQPIELSERQKFVIEALAMPAIIDTLSEVLAPGEQIRIPQETFVTLLSKRDFESYYGASDKPFAGLYYADRNQIIINQGNHASDSPEDLAYFTKVFIHEFFHYISHQYSELNRQNSSLLIRRVGTRALGEDIRDTNIGELTWDYNVASNEAITEMLAIAAFQKLQRDTTFRRPDGTQALAYETYYEYRILFEAVLQEASKPYATNKSLEDLWGAVYRGYVVGEIQPLIDIVHATYPGMSMKEFSLMTSVNDLPKENDFIWRSRNGTYSRTLSEAYLTRLRNRLNGKNRREYITDVALPPPPPSSVSIYAQQIRSHRAKKIQASALVVDNDGKFVDKKGITVTKDENGNIIHYDENWLVDVLDLMITVSNGFRIGTITSGEATKAIDKMLFERLHISELSRGFSWFFVAKHQLLDPNISTEEFNNVLEQTRKKLTKLQDTQ